MQERDDLALLQRMTRGLRTVLESAGVATCAAAAAMSVESLARRTHLEAPLLRRIKRAAEARRLGDILHEPRGRRTPVDPAALVNSVGNRTVPPVVKS